MKAKYFAYKQGVTGSNPVSPTKASHKREAFFIWDILFTSFILPNLTAIMLVIPMILKREPESIIPITKDLLER